MEQRIHRDQRMRRAARWHVAAIQEGVNVNPLGAASGSQPRHRKEVFFMAMHAAGRKQPQQMHSTPARDSGINGIAEGGVVVEVAVGHGLRDAREVLMDDATCAEIHVANL